MRTTRQQLSMYVPAEAARGLEAVRAAVDPIQHRLIPAHVTLAREDELGDPAELHRRLSAHRLLPITLRFGPPEPFAGHGILRPCVDGEDAFRALREQLLDARPLRRQAPHLTLAHPRNPRAPGNSLAAAAAGLPAFLELTFPMIRLIEQEAAAEPWRILATYGQPTTGASANGERR